MSRSSTRDLTVGNNLIKAHLDLGRLDAARRILDALYALKRPDWRETLGFWDKELAKARLGPPLPAQSPAFAVSPGAWSDEAAVSFSQHGDAESDYVVVLLLKIQADPWTAVLRIVRSTDSSCLQEIELALPSSETGASAFKPAGRPLAAIAAGCGIRVTSRPTEYQVPSGTDGSSYLLRLEQLLGVRCAGMEDVEGGFLYGEREVVDGNIALSLRRFAEEHSRTRAPRSDPDLHETSTSGHLA